MPFQHRLSELFVWSFRISLSGFDALHSGLSVLTVAIQVWIRGELFKSSNLFACVLLHFFVKKLLVNSLFRICFFLRSSENKAYPLLMENKVTYVYCHMTMATISNGQCGDGGWTLVMKIDGNQVKLKMNE